MKKYLFTIAILLCGLTFTSCNENDDDDVPGGPIEITEQLPKGTFEVEVQNLTATPAEHYVTLKWDAPEDASNLGGYLVEWVGKGSDKSVYSSGVSSDVTTIKADRLLNQEYTFTVKCVSVDLLQSVGVSINAKSTPDNTPPAKIPGMVPDVFAKGMTIEWEDASVDADLDRIHIVVTRKSDNVEMANVYLQPTMTRYAVAGLAELTEYTVTVTGLDYVGNISEPATADVKTFKEELLSKVETPWTLIDFSSQENSDRAEFAIDLDDKTFWHSNWTSGTQSLPQWIIFDLNQTVKPTEVLTYRRAGDARAQTRIKVEGSNDLTTWYDFGEHAISSDSDDGQPATLTSPKLVRYIKYSVTACKSSNHAMVRNIEIKALVEE